MGAGFGGLATANLLHKYLSSSAVEHQISIIDQKDYFRMGLVNLWILSGIRTLENSKVALKKLEKRGIKFLNEEVTAIDVASKTVTVRRSPNLKLEYDYLVVALGVEFALEQVKGFVENEGFNLYDADQVPKLRDNILSLQKGRIAICITSIPYKCPPAPYEASLIN